MWVNTLLLNKKETNILTFWSFWTVAGINSFSGLSLLSLATWQATLGLF